jgi:hypothetical protein
MNHLINSVLNKIPAPIRWAIGIGLAITLAFFLWYQGTRIWNGIDNAIFAAKMSWQEKNLKQELDGAATRKQELEKTLTELAVVKKDYEDAKAEKDRLEAISNDSAKSAAQKVAEFKKLVAENPVSTPTDGITSESLCQRARAMGASEATIGALCH